MLSCSVKLSLFSSIDPNYLHLVFNCDVDLRNSDVDLMSGFVVLETPGVVEFRSRCIDDVVRRLVFLQSQILTSDINDHNEATSRMKH